MGRLIGRRPDPTPAIRRMVGRWLAPDEPVLAGVHLQRPGTTSAATSTGVSAAVSATTGIHGATTGADRGWSDWAAQAVDGFGVAPEAARRAIFLTLVLTDSRLLLLRRGALLRGRPREVVGSWPLAEIDRVAVPRGGSALVITRGGAELCFELPQRLKFLAPVYGDLPELVERARSDVGRGEGAGTAPDVDGRP